MADFKPYMGKIKDWKKYECVGGLGYFIQGTFMGHPQFNGYKGWTSCVISHDTETNQIETENDRYILE